MVFDRISGTREMEPEGGLGVHKREPRGRGTMERRVIGVLEIGFGFLGRKKNQRSQEERKPGNPRVLDRV